MVTTEELVELRLEHLEDTWHDGGCRICGGDEFPCPVLRLAEGYEARGEALVALVTPRLAATYETDIGNIACTYCVAYLDLDEGHRERCPITKGRQALAAPSPGRGEGHE